VSKSALCSHFPVKLTLSICNSASHSASTQISSVEILPSAFPADASKSFSTSLLPYLRRLLAGPLPSTSAADSIEAALDRATLVKGGKLQKQHEWLAALLAEKGKRKKAVLLGAGYVSLHLVVSRTDASSNRLVAGPALRTLAARKDIDVVVGSLTVLLSPFPSRR
jgi:alpha-aminoadipic semialdehyde synthase